MHRAAHSRSTGEMSSYLLGVAEVVEDQQMILVELGDGAFQRQRLTSLLQALHEIGCPHTIAVYASPQSSPSAPQHSLPGGRYPLPEPVFHRLDRASFAWRTRNAPHPASNLAESRQAASLAIIVSQHPLGNDCGAASILLFP